jgi:peptide-methionine (S)-S-oxide reductase
MERPTYEKVSNGTTGHAEAIQLIFDPSLITYERLLEIFFHTHDPTTPNRQGADVGTQYRSAVFFHTAEQRKIAQKKIKVLEESHAFKGPIVTEVVPATIFTPAEEYHKNYYAKNGAAPYCQVVIDPKIRKLFADFRKDIKEDYRSEDSFSILRESASGD